MKEKERWRERVVREGASTQNLNHRKYLYFLPASKQAFPRRVAEVESELSESEKEHEREREVVMGGGGAMILVILCQQIITKG